MSKVLGIIPARGGSKGIPDKNIRELAGKPLIEYAYESAKASGVFERIVLSTDSESIAALGREIGLELPFMRPSELAQDDTAMLPVLQHALGELENEGWSADIVILLQATSPLRQAAHIRNALEKLTSSDADSVVSVIEIPHLFAPQKALRKRGDSLQFWLEDGKGISRRQQLETSYAREGTVYAFWRDVLMEKNSIYGDKCLPLVLDAGESLTLDTEKDWEKAERILLKRAGKKK